MEENETLTKDEFADKLAHSLEKRGVLCETVIIEKRLFTIESVLELFSNETMSIKGLSCLIL